jgi:hypothetical protein
MCYQLTTLMASPALRGDLTHATRRVCYSAGMLKVLGKFSGFGDYLLPSQVVVTECVANISKLVMQRLS